MHGETTAASRWRVEVGQLIAGTYATDQRVVAAMVAGSSARGQADKYSDIEALIVWSSPPDAETRQSVLDALNVDHGRCGPLYQPLGMWPDDFLYGRNNSDEENSGVLVEVNHMLADHVDTVIAAVTEHADPDPDRQMLLSGLLAAVPVTGTALIDDWRSRAVYPDALATAVVRRFGQIDHFWRHRMWAERENPFMQTRQTWDIQRKIVHMLLAANRRFFDGLKWIDSTLSNLAVAPPNVAERFQHASTRANDPAAIDDVRLLVEETYDIVADHVPDIDVSRLREIFRWERPLWDTAAPANPSK